MTNDVRISKKLSRWLRHRPDEANLTLDAQGWTDVEGILAALERASLDCDRQRLLNVVERDDKQRYELSSDESRIRARQGHSVSVALGWPRVSPPTLLYHGTVERFLREILSEGLKPMRRHHVHLSSDVEAARRTGARRGPPVILAVHSAAMAEAGQQFFLTDNGVWLTDAVPPNYLSRVEEQCVRSSTEELGAHFGAPAKS